VAEGAKAAADEARRAQAKTESFMVVVDVEAGEISCGKRNCTGSCNWKE